MSRNFSSNSLLKGDNNSSENGSSNGEVGGNNSDNSALVSLGNTSFGFNFDSEEGTNVGSEEGDSSDQGVGGGGGGSTKATTTATRATAVKTAKSRNDTNNNNNNHKKRSATLASGGVAGQSDPIASNKPNQSQSSSSLLPPAAAIHARPPSKSTLTAGAAAAKISSDSSSAARSFNTNTTTNTLSSSHSDAASQAVSNLHSIATAAAEGNADKQPTPQGIKKRKAPETATSSTTTNLSADNESSNGYNSDDEGKAGQSHEQKHKRSMNQLQAGYQHHHHQHHQMDMEPVTSKNVNADLDDDYDEGDDNEDDDEEQRGTGSRTGSKRKKKKLDDSKREERNAREKERSFRISRQINELRNLLSSGGVIVPKGTKSSVLTEAANYIRMLQQHQYRSEIDRHQLVQQIQMIGGGALGQQAATAVRHAAAQNGVWSLGNFGGVPPKSAMMYHQSGTTPGADVASAQNVPPGQEVSSALPNKIEEGDYRHIFNSCTVAMAIASMGGAFIDCNKLFCQLSNFTKQEVCSMTVFNLTARQDLQPAFDLISQMLSAPADSGPSNMSCVLRGSFKHCNNLGLNVALIKGDDDVAKCFCVTLIMNPSSPFDTSRPVPATIELLGGNQSSLSVSKDPTNAGMDPSPAYTAG
ncbi:PAS domain S-box containing protein [Nitzschia inconspicua]|uniref:PAS domain S-box containing protein n=1 Tax=Nitzschia inconspicua TaxID=303405 RepID=A0A9K3KAD1_9STRA|nr:PAS domain S-box containing protein [Nitzschia inconspicua]